MVWNQTLLHIFKNIGSKKYLDFDSYFQVIVAIYTPEKAVNKSIGKYMKGSRIGLGRY